MVCWLETVLAFSLFSSRKASPSKEHSGQVAAPSHWPSRWQGMVKGQCTVRTSRGTRRHSSTPGISKEIETNEQHHQEILAFENYVH